MTHASVFSGIGVPEVAAAMLGWDNLFHCEINDFGRKVLEYHFPKSKSYGDITKTNFTEWRGKVDVLTGGFPCQPFSTAGKRRGAEDDRFLWPHMLRVITEVRPTWFVAENVGGIRTSIFESKVTTMAVREDIFGEEDVCDECLHEKYIFAEICDQIQSAGYSVQPILIPSCGVGAPHRRDRIFFVAHRNDSADTNLQRFDQSNTTNITNKEERFDCKKDSYETKGAAANTEEIVWNDERLGEGNDIQPKVSKSGERGSENGNGYRFAADTCRFGRTQTSTKGAMEAEASVECEQNNKQTHESNIRVAADTDCERIQRCDCVGDEFGELCEERTPNKTCTPCRDGLLSTERWRNFPTVSPVYRGNDGIPFSLDELTISPSKWATESLKAYGNAIVPQVMYEIFAAIEAVENM